MAVNPYIALKEAYLNNVKKAQANEQNQLKEKYNQNLQTANQQYDKNANNAYITYKQSLAQLPEQLSNQGLTGGASESANIKLQTAYANNLSNNELGRQSTTDKLTNDYNVHLGDLNNAYLKQISGATADYDRQIAAWDDAERQRQEAERIRQEEIAREERIRQEEIAREEAKARASYYSSGGYGGYNDYSSYAEDSGNSENSENSGNSGNSSNSSSNSSGTSGKAGGSKKKSFKEKLKKLLRKIKNKNTAEYHLKQLESTYAPRR